MYIQRNQSKNSKTGKVYTSVLLCSKYREGKKTKTRTVVNLSHLSDQLILSIENAKLSGRYTPACATTSSAAGKPLVNLLAFLVAFYFCHFSDG